jgi:hypothetical protein
MDAPFPFGFPFATGGYFVLYVLTWVSHALGVAYVLTGAGWLLAHQVRGGETSSVPRIFRDWLPMGLSIAITAAIAPLLFLQVLYRSAYYTANLLLFHRWMSVLPVLIVGFYLIYLLKSGALVSRPRLRILAATGICLCFLWTAWAFTENHLLSIASSSTQVAFYAESRIFYRGAELLPRLLMWLAGLVPVGCALVAWQVRGIDPAPHEDPPADWRRLATVALLGLGAAVGCASWYAVVLGPGARALVQPGELPGHALVWPYLAVFCVSGLVAGALWWRIRRRAGATRGALLALTVATVTLVLSTAVIREVLRIQAFGADAMSALAVRHARSATASGLPVFLVCAVVVAVAIVVIVRAMRRAPRANRVDGENP